jgi:putative spermidine/putrescine transport system substrate-binding protein
VTVGSNHTKHSRRKILALGGGALASTFMINRGSAAARELRILIAGGSWRDWFHETFAQPFAQAKGIELTYRLGLTFEPLVMAQRRSPQWDIIHQSQNRASALGAMGLLKPWTADRIPNVAKIHESFRYEYIVGKIHTPYGLCVNTRHIRTPVDSWAALWDPAARGKVGFPAWNWVGDEVFYAINSTVGGTIENIDPGIARLKELFRTNQAKVVNNVEHARQLLLADEIWIMPHFGARTEQAAAAGAPVQFVIPKEGGLSWIFNTSIIGGRPQDSIALAEEFVNTTLDAEKQIQFARLTGYPPTNVEAMRNLPNDLARLRISDADLQALGRLQRDFDYMALFAYRDQHVERWNREVIASG